MSVDEQQQFILLLGQHDAGLSPRCTEREVRNKSETIDVLDRFAPRRQVFPWTSSERFTVKYRANPGGSPLSRCLQVVLARSALAGSTRRRSQGGAALPNPGP